jgi:6-phosphogluconate dehydrogenase
MAAQFIEVMRKAGECADMELLAEAYHILKHSVRMSHDEMRTVFAEWNKSELSNRLLSATADVLGVRDEDDEALVEKVLDSPEGKSAGLAALEAALALGQPAGLLSAAVFSHSLASLKDERVGASAVLGGPKPASTGERHAMVEDLRKALLAARIISYAEILSIMTRAAGGPKPSREGLEPVLDQLGTWDFSADFLDRIRNAYRLDPALPSILVDSRFKSLLDQSLPSLRKVCTRAVDQGTPVPALGAAIAYYDGYRSTWLPANLVLALGDHAASRGYERVDRPRGERFHSEWK